MKFANNRVGKVVQVVGSLPWVGVLLVAVAALTMGHRPPPRTEALESAPKPSVVLCSNEECRFSVVSYNVRGIFVPQTGLKSRTDRFPLIGRRLGDVGVLMLQEYFLRPGGKEKVPELLLDAAPQPTRRVAPRTPARYYNSGLAMLLLMPEEWIVETEFEPYDDCHGDLLPIKYGNDCLARKGVFFVRLALPFGEVDFYTTHVDAGGSVRDHEVKSLQHEQMARFVEKHSGGSARSNEESGTEASAGSATADTKEARAVILGGDFNSRLDSSDEPSKTLLRETSRLGLVSINQLTEPNRDLCHDWGKCEDAQIDHLFVRESKDVEIVALRSWFDEVMDEESGLKLSDHPVLGADLSFRRATKSP